MSSPPRYTRSPNGTNIDSQDTFKNNETHAMFSPTCVSMKSQLPSKKSNTDNVQTTYSVSSKSLFAKPNKRESKKMFDEMLVFQDLFRDDTTNTKKNERGEEDTFLETFPLHIPTKTSCSNGDETKMVLKRQRTASVVVLPNDLDLPTFEQEEIKEGQPKRRAVVRPRLAPIPHSSRKEITHFKKVDRGSLFDPDELNEVVASSTTTTPPCRRSLSPRNSCLLMLPEIDF